MCVADDSQLNALTAFPFEQIALLKGKQISAAVNQAIEEFNFMEGGKCLQSFLWNDVADRLLEVCIDIHG